MNDEIKKQQQVAQDMLTVVSNQRNNAQNEAVQLAAQIMALQREIEELKKAVVPDVDGPKINGHAEEARAGA